MSPPYKGNAGGPLQKIVPHPNLPPANPPYIPVRVNALLATTEGRSGSFAPTHWSVILAAGQSEAAPERARLALTQLCQTYWGPLYGYVRSFGHARHDAQDLTQGFFAYMIAHETYARAVPQRGKFRSFLLTSMKNFLADAGDHVRALKRGGAHTFLPLHEAQIGDDDAGFHAQVDGLGPDEQYERNWAETLVTAALSRTSAAYAADGRADVFAALQCFLTMSADPLPTYEQLADRLGTPAPTLRSLVTRLRRRYREFLRAEVRRTVETEAQVDEELRELMRVLSAG